MQFKVLCLIALVACASATLTDEEGQEKLDRMQSSHFGRTILDTIALQLETDDSADDLILMLRAAEDKKFSEQKKDDTTQMDLQNQCYDDLNRLTAEIQAAQKRVNQIDEELNEKIPIRDGKIDERNDLEEFKALLLERLNQMLANKNLRNEQWAKTKADHDHASQVVQNAKMVLENALRSKSFLQKNSSVFAEMTSTFAEAKKTHFLKKSWNSYFKVLATITTSIPAQADSGLVDKIMALCDRLLDEISKSREVERRAYDLWMGEYDRTKAGIDKRLDETETTINLLTVEINSLTKRINMLQQEKIDQLERIEAKTEERENRKVFCDDEATAYSQRRQARTDELEVISDAIAMLMSKLRMLKKFTSKATSGLKKPTL